MGQYKLEEIDERSRLIRTALESQGLNLKPDVTCLINRRHLIWILNWNGLADTLECLESIYKMDYPNYKVIVVDNAWSK